MGSRLNMIQVVLTMIQVVLIMIQVVLTMIQVVLTMIQVVLTMIQVLYNCRLWEILAFSIVFAKSHLPTWIKCILTWGKYSSSFTAKLMNYRQYIWLEHMDINNGPVVIAR